MSNTAPGVRQEDIKAKPVDKAADRAGQAGSSKPGLGRVLKTGMISNKQESKEIRGVRDDIEQEDEEESYYR